MAVRRGLLAGLLAGVLLVTLPVRAAPPAAQRRRPAASGCRPVPADAKVARPRSAAGGDAIELGELVGWISGLSCRQYVLAEKLRTSKVTLLGPGRLSAGEAQRLFLSALEAMGLTVQTSGATTKILEKDRAVTSAVPTYGHRDPAPADDRVITRLVRLRQGRADEVAQLLAGLKGREEQITVDTRTNTLIVTGVASRLVRLLRIIDVLGLEREGAGGVDRIYVYRAVHANASYLVEKLLALLDPAGTGAPTLPLQLGELRISAVVADDRTQQIFIAANEPGHARIRSLLGPIDRVP
jgi:type II secretory pathway component GspD/PulD (secretin)